MPDLSEMLIARVAQARAEQAPLALVGGRTKAFLGRRSDAQPLEVGDHAGIVEHVPEELVLTARAGTRVAEIEQVLDDHDQMLGFEPPRFGANATIGGTLATNLSGPARPWRGSIRDAVLGVRLISGRAEHLRFGGKVMKNVAGFDVARLQAGAFGAYGIVTEVSLRVVPRPERETTIAQACGADAAIERMTQLARRPEPLSGAAWVNGLLRIRLAGADAAVTAAMRRIGGDEVTDAGTFWRHLGALELPFFTGDAPLWRLSVKPSMPVNEALGAWLLDWGGAQRFLRARVNRAMLEREVDGGHVTCLRGREDGTDFAPEPAASIKALHLRLKRAFDPEGVINPGRLYRWL